MEKDEIKQLEAVNYWHVSPKTIGFVRESYVQQILGYTGNNLLKVLVGQRRCGKSYILKQVIDSLLKQGAPNCNILYLNFELHGLHFIHNVEKLTEVIKYFYQQHKLAGKAYIFLDEIQEIPQWEKLLNSLLADENIDAEIFITGSNAHLLSTELSTFVTGRYVEIAIFPFSFQEYSQFYSYEMNRLHLIEYLESSGIPELFNLKSQLQRSSYLAALKDSILMNDIVKRFKIKNPKLLMLLLDFIIDNIGHLFSIPAIARKLKSWGKEINIVTVSNYLQYLEMTYLIHGIPRYDIKRKRILEGERKYYLNDLGFYNYLMSSFDNGINKKLENYVYQVLLQAGYKVYVGTLYQLEIDFVAEKNQRIIYLQVTYLLHSQEVIAREYGNLEKINDNWPKMVVSLDEVAFPPKNGIEHIPAWQLIDNL